MNKLIIKIEMKSKLPPAVTELHSGVGVFKRDGDNFFVCEDIEFSDFLKTVIDDNLSVIMGEVSKSVDKKFAPKTGKSNYSNVIEDIFIEVK